MTKKRYTTKSPMVRVHANALAHHTPALGLSLLAAALLCTTVRPAAAEVTAIPAVAETPEPTSAPQAAPPEAGSTQALLAAPAPATAKPEQPNESKAAGANAEEGGGDLFVHPFLAHMSLVDPPGTASFRFSGIRYKSDLDTGSDFAVHIEAGILPRLGIHIRTDSVKREPFSEVMVMYNIFTTQGGAFGVSGFGQVSIPTGPEAGRTYKGLVGAAVMVALAPVVVFNGNVHYDPKNTMAEWEGAFVFRGSKFLYPVLEFRGELTKHRSDDTAYVLVGTKFRIMPKQTIGAGFQIAMTSTREYNDEALLQYGIEF